MSQTVNSPGLSGMNLASEEANSGPPLVGGSANIDPNLSISSGKSQKSPRNFRVILT